MNEFFSTIRLMAGLFAVLMFTLLVLLSLPQSRLKEIVQPFVGWAVAALSVAYVITPVDVLPDFIPGIGFGDDALALVVGLFSAVAASTAGKATARLPDRSAEK